MERIKQVLAQDDTVLFVGSGISLWAGLPTWSGMIEELAKFIECSGGKPDLIRSEAKRGDLLQAASYGFDKLTKQQIGEFIRKACRYGSAKPHEIHQKIVSLGPRCFITTNYDDLIEQSLRKWQSDRFYKPPVTNRHLTETAEIVHARAIDFVFKPHGDAGDSESIILTREQYRQLLPQGERQAALESVRMLLASRPVIYLGFGLRDPDFIYVRDLLANTYKGGTRDHYAVMADISEGETDYWRRNFGIHLIGYATTEGPDKSRDHTGLVTLLEKLLERPPVANVAPAFDPQSPEVLLALARHAAALARTPKLAHELPIRVHAEKRRAYGIWQAKDKFDHSSVERLLDNSPERAILIGLPGAGKTYSIRRAAARIAEKMNQTCLSEPFDPSAVVVPIIVDLKLYRGNLNQLVNQLLPSSLPLYELIKSFKVKVFLDSFNEMPREYWESGSYESDFKSFMNSLGASTVIVGSRTSDGLTKLDMPAYCLDQIDEEAVAVELQRLGLTFEGRFGDETRRLLQRPFYFQHVASGAITLPKESHPRDFYKCLFVNTNEAFSFRFGQKFNLEAPLATVAYDALNRGEEAFPISELISSVMNALDTEGVRNISSKDIANWLVSRSILLPYSGSRVAFFHQSVTEYLAATELAKIYITSPQVLKEKLLLTRWDQALFLTLSLLPPGYGDPFLSDVIEADFVLALNAAKYLESGRDQVISKLLSEVPSRYEPATAQEWRILDAIESGLPISEVHESELRAIMACGDSLGGAAVFRLVEIKGEQIKDEVLKLLLDKRSDYSFCTNGIGSALKRFATPQDASIIATWSDTIQGELPDHGDEDINGGFTSGAAEVLSKLDLSVIRNALLPSDQETKIPEIRARIICGILHEHHSTAALNFASDLLLRGVKSASTAICFIAEHGKDGEELSWGSFTYKHVQLLQENSKSTDDNWDLKALRHLCKAREDLATLVRANSSRETCIAKAALLHCVSPKEQGPIFSALRELITLSKEARINQPLNLLNQIDIDWTGNADLFVELLRTRDTTLSHALLGQVIPPKFTNLDILEIGDIDWWLEWMLEVKQAENDENRYWLLMQLGALCANQVSPQIRDLFIAEFNKPNSKYRNILHHFVMPYFTELTTDAFSEDAISFLLADLNRKGAAAYFQGNILGNIASERFITDRLLPLLPDAKPPLAENIQRTLDKAGSRHGRRYVTEKGELN